MARVGGFGPFELVLFVRALPLVWRAQTIRSVPIHDVVGELGRRGGGMATIPIDRLVRATERACRYWQAWFGGLNTCLVRSLVLGTLLAGRGDVVLNLGFRPGDGSEPGVAGHAWVTVDGQPVGDDGHLAEARYTRVLELPYRASARGTS